MSDIAAHVRIFEAEPTDDFVEKRTSAIKDLSARFGKRDAVPQILQLANDLAIGASRKHKLPDALAADVEAAIKKHSTAFVQKGQELQMLVCALLAALQYLAAASPSQGQLSRADVLASGLWLALSFQPPRSEAKLEALRLELLQRSRDLVIATSSSARKRTAVPDLTITVPADVDWAKFADQAKSGAAKTIDSLRTNAALDREEIDLLWWVLGDWSDLLGAKLSSMPAQARAVGSGLEVARLLRRLPGDAHKHLVIRNVVSDEELTLVTLIQELGKHRIKLAAAFEGNATLTACGFVFPLLTAISTGEVVGPTSKTKRSLSDWAGRALLESAVLHVTSLPKAMI